MKANKKLLGVCLTAVIVATLVVAFVIQSAFASGNKTVKALVTQYYDAVLQNDFETALGLLYRTENTIFTDEFLSSGMREEPLIYYNFQSAKQLTKDVYEITGIGKCDDGRGERTITNYVINYNSKYYFVINWIDVPEELCDRSYLREAMGF